MKKMVLDRDQLVNDSFSNLIEAATKVNPKLGAALYNKYEEDRNNFIDAIHKEVNSREKTSWAKPHCTKCYGSGIIGTRDNVPLYCQCINKQFSKWIKVFRKEYKQRDMT